MRGLSFVVLAVLLTLCSFVSVAVADEVQVFLPVENGLSPMALQKKAMAEGFAQAVHSDAKAILPEDLDEARVVALKQYLLDHSKPFVQGYKVLSSQNTQEGIHLALDVVVNRESLRNALKSMGLFETALQLLDASVIGPMDLNETERLQLQGLMTLTGIQNGPDLQPSFTLERASKSSFRGRLDWEGQQWTYTHEDMAVVWCTLWSHYFNRDEAVQVHSGVYTLTVNGWFSPDAVLEFDRVLKGWDFAVSDVHLLEIGMQPSSVGGTWEAKLIDGERFDSLLRSYLPQRGLTCQVLRNAKE